MDSQRVSGRPSVFGTGSSESPELQSALPWIAEPDSKEGEFTSSKHLAVKVGSPGPTRLCAWEGTPPAFRRAP